MPLFYNTKYAQYIQALKSVKKKSPAGLFFLNKIKTLSECTERGIGNITN
jgi:hypothetical protein